MHMTGLVICFAVLEVVLELLMLAVCSILFATVEFVELELELELVWLVSLSPAAFSKSEFCW